MLTYADVCCLPPAPLAALKLAEHDLQAARQYAEEASVVIEVATRVAHHPTLNPLMFLAEERVRVDLLLARLAVLARDAPAAQASLAAAHNSLASARARAGVCVCVCV